MRAGGYAALAALIVAAPAGAQQALTPDEQAAAFIAAGFEGSADQWQACGDPGTESYLPGEITEVRDLNGDGEPEAIIIESSTFCFGLTGMGYALVSRGADGAWRQVTGGPGMPRVLATAGTGGWPDLEIGGPGFCFPIERWNGREYAVHRHEYEGKPCEPAD